MYGLCIRREKNINNRPRTMETEGETVEREYLRHLKSIDEIINAPGYIIGFFVNGALI